MRDGLERPPTLAYWLVRWSLPALLREQILGDLEEEFKQLHRQQQGSPALWYWDQALRTTAIYVWQQRGDVMAFLLSVLVFMGSFVFASWLGGEFGSLVNIPSVIVVFPVALVFAIGASSWQAAKDSLALSFSDVLDVEPQRLLAAKTFLVTFSRSAFHTGVLFTFVGFVFMGDFITKDNLEVLGLSFAVALLTLIYGYALKIIADVALAKITLRYQGPTVESLLDVQH